MDKQRYTNMQMSSHSHTNTHTWMQTSHRICQELFAEIGRDVMQENGSPSEAKASVGDTDDKPTTESNVAYGRRAGRPL